MDFFVKTPKIDELGLINEDRRLDGPSFVDTIGGEYYSMDECVILIHCLGYLNVGRANPNPASSNLDWTPL